MKLDKGITHVKNSTLSDTVFLVNRGDISMTDMKSNNDIKLLHKEVILIIILAKNLKHFA